MHPVRPVLPTCRASSASPVPWARPRSAAPPLIFSLATVLAGANLGADRKPGGGDDTFAAGSINALNIAGTISGSVLAAGVDPLDGIFANGDGTRAGADGAIRLLAARAGTDSANRFEAHAFGTARLPKKVSPAMDSRFITV